MSGHNSLSLVSFRCLSRKCWSSVRSCCRHSTLRPASHEESLTWAGTWRAEPNGSFSFQAMSGYSPFHEFIIIKSVYLSFRDNFNLTICFSCFDALWCSVICSLHDAKLAAKNKAADTVNVHGLTDALGFYAFFFLP